MIKRTDQPLRILLSNDDGIHAPGLQSLEKIARTLTDDIWIVAPEAEQSGAAHSLTLGRPLRIRKLGEKTFSVDGTPTDCVMIALNKLITDRPP
jgi:5'-nucleotidase